MSNKKPYGPVTMVKDFYRRRVPVMEVICQTGVYSSAHTAVESIKNAIKRLGYRDKIDVVYIKRRIYLFRSDMKNLLFPYGGEIYVDGKIVKMPPQDLRRKKKPKNYNGTQPGKKDRSVRPANRGKEGAYIGLNKEGKNGRQIF